jgi:glycosyltransferase involved in cell wall biosynthesis
MSVSLSVVMPVHNEARHLDATIGALVSAVHRTDFDAELVLVDDGSTDRSVEVARRAADRRLPLRVVTQPNQGRLAARRAGLEATQGELVLLLDGRVRLRPKSLRFVQERVRMGERVWNGHVDVLVAGNPYGAFWKVLVELAWRDYFSEPRTTSYDSENFDRYPKGTTCFLAPRELLLELLGAAWSRYSDSRHANDDTPMIRAIAERTAIHISPSFSCEYTARGTLRSFVSHAVHRGTVFLDGHGVRESRFFVPVIAFYPLSAMVAALCFRRPALVSGLAFASAASGAAFAARAGSSRFEAVSFGALVPVYAVAHGLGMWRGLGLIARAKAETARA